MAATDGLSEGKDFGPHLRLLGQNPQCSVVSADLCAVIKIRESTGLEHRERSSPGEAREDQRERRSNLEEQGHAGVCVCTSLDKVERTKTK